MAAPRARTTGSSGSVATTSTDRARARWWLVTGPVRPPPRRPPPRISVSSTSSWSSSTSDGTPSTGRGRWRQTCGPRPRRHMPAGFGRPRRDRGGMDTPISAGALPPAEGDRVRVPDVGKRDLDIVALGDVAEQGVPANLDLDTPASVVLLGSQLEVELQEPKGCAIRGFLPVAHSEGLASKRGTRGGGCVAIPRARRHPGPLRRGQYDCRDSRLMRRGRQDRREPRPGGPTR
jgi:hypothetical protein